MRCGQTQISKELKQYYEVEDLDDVRVIRDRQTSRNKVTIRTLKNEAKIVPEISRGFGFLRFTSLESARIFMERNYPTIHLHANNTSNGDNEAAKVRIAFSRERDDRNREKPDSEWVCKIVSGCRSFEFLSIFNCILCETAQESHLYSLSVLRLCPDS